MLALRGDFVGSRAIELYAEAFEHVGQLARLEAFASHTWPDFYCLPRSRADYARAHGLERALVHRFASDELVPFRAGETSPGDSRLRGRLRLNDTLPMQNRFRGFMPVVIDVECGGFIPYRCTVGNCRSVVGDSGDGSLAAWGNWRYHVQPFPAPTSNGVTRCDGLSILFTRYAQRFQRRSAHAIVQEISQAMKDNDCTRAILVGHNACFDLNFLNAAVARTEIKRNPFHPFSSFDTATLAGVAFGQTGYRSRFKRPESLGIRTNAFGAYDAQQTADCFARSANEGTGDVADQEAGDEGQSHLSDYTTWSIRIIEPRRWRQRR